jgi:hypothetical protein
MELQITVDEKKAKHFLAFLKDLDFVTVKPMPVSKKKAVAKTQNKTELTDEDFPYFGSCPEWDVDADELRYGGAEKRLKGWL